MSRYEWKVGDKAELGTRSPRRFRSAQIVDPGISEDGKAVHVRLLDSPDDDPEYAWEWVIDLEPIRDTLTADSPIIQEALSAWHEAGRASFNRAYVNLDYDGPNYTKTARERRKYIALDRGSSGAFLVDKQTGEVYVIKGYGVPGRRIMHIDQFVTYWRQSADDNPYRLIYKRGLSR